MGKYMGTSEAAQKWGISQSKITKLCREGKIKGAEQDKGGRNLRKCVGFIGS